MKKTLKYLILNRYLQYFLFSIVLLGITSCAFRKKTGELNGLGKLYHNTTSHYNGYFNANVLLEESYAALEQQHKENYNDILPVYPYTRSEKPDAVAGNLDNAIEKVSIVVNLHQESNWVDDCYLMVGEAQFVKQDYEAAEETMEYFKEEFDPKNPKKRKFAPKKRKTSRTRTSNRRTSTRSKSKSKAKSKSAKAKNRERKKANKERKKKIKERKKNSKKGIRVSKEERAKIAAAKKKEAELKEKAKTAQEISNEVVDKADAKEKAPKEKEDSKFLKHKPAYQKGMLLLAKTYVEREKYSRAESILKDLEKRGELYKETIKEIPVVMAYRHLEQGNYSSAIPHLEEAIELATKKKNRARYSYILAQLYQKNNREEEAYAMFDKVAKMNPSYEMEFNARLNIERNAWVAGKSSAEDILRSLNRMAKDSKNEEYKDQVYYAMAEVELSRKNKKEAIEHLVASIEANTKNPAQLLESNYLLGDLYYQNDEYVNAKKHLDAAVANMSENDERYDETKRLAANLTEIAANIQTIELQDSLLRIAGMSEKEQKALAAKLKKEMDESDTKGGLAAAGGSKGGGKNSPMNPGRTVSSAGAGVIKNTSQSNYWAYNDKSVKKGQREFDKLWGERKLADDWRRSSKSSGSTIDDGSTEAVVDDEIAGVSNKEIDRILKDVPKTEDEILTANNKIRDAMYKLGTLYRDRIQNYEKSIEVLESLMSRYPKNIHELDAWYYLYLANMDLNNVNRANFYLAKITDAYPESTIAKVLTDPNFINISKEEDRKLQSYYNETYVAFKQGKYAVAADKIKESDLLFGPKNKLKAKFALLGAMCKGSSDGKDAYVEALKNFIANYKNTEEETKAKEILLLLRGNRFSTRLDNSTIKEKGIFADSPESQHYILIIMYNPDVVGTNDAKLTISRYNESYHKLEKLRMSTTFLDREAKVPTILLRRFNNKEKAMTYYKNAMRKKTEFLPSNADFEIFPITTKNFSELMRMHNADPYREFFEENYK